MDRPERCADDDPRPAAVRREGDAHLVEQRIDSTVVFDGALLHVRRDTVRLPDGRPAKREYIVHPGAVLVVPVRADGKLVVERQFRYPLNRVLIEFPAGKIDRGESPRDCADRELREEAGFRAASMTSLGLVHTVVSYSTEAIELFVATGLTDVGRKLDDGEFLDLEALALADLLALVDRGEITDVKTVAALLLYARRLGR